MMKYLKVYTNFRRSMQGLTDDEKGRLFDAMLAYIETGEEPTFSGNERFLWGAVLNMFDAQKEFNEKQRQNGMKGGRPPKMQESNETQNNPEKPKETQINPENPKRKEMKRNEKKRNIYTDMPDRFSDFWESYPKKTAKQDAERAWKKLNPSTELADRIIADVTNRKGSNEWTKDGGQYIPYPATYLNKRRWEDEFTIARHGYAEHTASNLDHLLVNLDN